MLRASTLLLQHTGFGPLSCQANAAGLFPPVAKQRLRACTLCCKIEASGLFPPVATPMLRAFTLLLRNKCFETRTFCCGTTASGLCPLVVKTQVAEPYPPVEKQRLRASTLLYTNRCVPLRSCCKKAADLCPSVVKQTLPASTLPLQMKNCGPLTYCCEVKCFGTLPSC